MRFHRSFWTNEQTNSSLISISIGTATTTTVHSSQRSQFTSWTRFPFSSSLLSQSILSLESSDVRSMYPFHIILVIPATNAVSERSFSSPRRGKIISEIDNDPKKTEQHNGFGCAQGSNRSTVTDWNRQWSCAVVRSPETSLWQIYTNWLTVAIFRCDSVPSFS